MALASEQIENTTDYSHLSALELIRNNIETERLQVIPVGSVLTEEALVDEGHADELGASMDLKRGQVSPITVRARLNEAGEIVYDVIDGFHRTAAKKDKERRILAQTGRLVPQTIEAKVLYACSDEEMFDLRVLAVNSVRSVQFPRIAQWITNSFESSEFADCGLTVAQAFALTLNDSKRSTNANLSEEQIKGIKAWARLKCQVWGKPLQATYNILRLVANADPELVKQVRTSGGGKGRSGKITPARLQSVVEGFPGEENWHIQRALLRVSVENRYSAGETALLVEKVKEKITPDMDEEKIYGIALFTELQILPVPVSDEEHNGEVEETNDPWEEFADEEKVGSDSTIVATPLSGEDEGLVKLVAAVAVEEPSAAEIAEMNRIMALEGDTEEARGFYRRRRLKSSSHDIVPRRNLAGGDDQDPVEMAKRIRDLEGIIETLSATDLGTRGSDHWWRTATYITPAERIVMEWIVGCNRSLTETSLVNNIPEANLVPLIISAFTRRSLAEKHDQPIIGRLQPE